MKRAVDEPSTSTGKRSRSRLITVQQVIDTLVDSDSEESEFHQEYVSSSSDTDSESSSDEENLEPYRSRARSIVREGGVSLKQLMGEI